MPKNGLNKGQIYFFLPAIIVISFIFLIPIINLFKLSFQDINIEARTTSFVGLQNYATLLKDNVFIKSVRNNLILISMVVPVLTALCVLFSVLLFECRRDFKFFQVTIFLPYILSITVVGILFTILLQKNGPINDILKSIGFGFLAIDWLGNPRIAILTVGLIIIWKELGFGTTLFLSRLMGISSDLIAAADIDGANWWRKVISIYIPHLSGIIFFYITAIPAQPRRDNVHCCNSCAISAGSPSMIARSNGVSTGRPEASRITFSGVTFNSHSTATTSLPLVLSGNAEEGILTEMYISLFTCNESSRAGDSNWQGAAGKENGRCKVAPG